MNWRVLATPTSQSDFERLSDTEQASLADDLFGWVENGPPCINRRTIAGAEVFQDEASFGLMVTYLVNETVPYVAVLRVRRR